MPKLRPVDSEEKALADELTANLAMDAKYKLSQIEDAIIIEDDRNARQRISDKLEELTTSLWYRGVDDMYGKLLLEKLYTFHNGGKPSKSDEIVLKYLRELADVKWYHDIDRTTVIQTNIKKIDSSNILKC